LVLKQLSRLSLEAEGRYATSEELQFVAKYRESLEVRLSTYQKLRDAEVEIINLVTQRSQKQDSELFKINSQDMTPTCHRDIQLVLRASAIAMLTDDLERLRDNLLLWQKTIVKALDHQKYVQIVYRILQDVVQELLSVEEAKLILPALKLSLNVLAY
jgi:hypothetical protein